MTCSFLRQLAGNSISAIYTACGIFISVIEKPIAIAISVAKFFTQPTVGFYFREFTEIAMNFVNISISVAERGTVGCDSGYESKIKFNGQYSLKVFRAAATYDWRRIHLGRARVGLGCLPRQRVVLSTGKV